MSEHSQSKFPPPQKRRLVLRSEDEKTLEFSPRDSQATRPPFASSQVSPKLSKAQSGAVDRSLASRERALQEAEARLDKRERTIWESETLLKAREEIIASREAQLSETPASVSGAVDEDTLIQFREDLNQQQAHLQEQELELAERERYLEESENRLLETTIKQQEEEARLEQLRDDLSRREMRLDQLMGKKRAPQSLDVHEQALAFPRPQ